MKPAFEVYLRRRGMPDDCLAALKAGEPMTVTASALASWMESAWIDGQRYARTMRHVRAQKEKQA